MPHTQGSEGVRMERSVDPELISRELLTNQKILSSIYMNEKWTTLFEP